MGFNSGFKGLIMNVHAYGPILCMSYIQCPEETAVNSLNITIDNAKQYVSYEARNNIHNSHIT